MTDEVKRICLWSGPRNVSTALMYAFSQRADTVCLDEPLYGHYLRVSGAAHPGDRKVMAAMDCDGARVVAEQILGQVERPMLFCKQMAHHLVALDRSFLHQVDNVILVRDPREVLITLTKQIPEPTLADTGYAVQIELLEELTPTAPVLDAQQLLRNPAGVIEQLCFRLGIQFDPAMLAWPPGPKPFDGVWAEHWYHNVHRSSGFARYRAKHEPVAQRLQPLLEQCEPLYQKLRSRAIEAA